MWKKILSLLLALVFFAALPLVSGCQEPEKDRVSYEKKTNIENVPVSEPKIKLTGDNP